MEANGSLENNVTHVNNLSKTGKYQENNAQSRSQQKDPNSSADSVAFRYVWPVKVALLQVDPVGDSTILHISPKFATVYERKCFDICQFDHRSAFI